MFAKRRIEPYVTPVDPSPVSAKDMLCSEFRQKSPIDQFLFEEREFDGEKSVRLTSDICMLFNQQRLDRLSRESLLSHFESMSVNEPKFGDIRSKLGDDQLLNFVKSRFIQSPSELMSWSQYLMNCSDSVVAELVAAQQDQQSRQTHQSVDQSASTE